MSSTLTPACPLCGLRYASKPLLELHIREDHRRRRRAQPAPPDVAGTQASPPPDRPAVPHREGGDRHASHPPPPARAGLTVPRRLLRALRHVNDELIRASQAIIRSARAPQPRPGSRHPRPAALTRAPPPAVPTRPPDPPAQHPRQQMTAPAGQPGRRGPAPPRIEPACSRRCRCSSATATAGPSSWPRRPAAPDGASRRRGRRLLRHHVPAHPAAVPRRVTGRLRPYRGTAHRRGGKRYLAD